MRDRNLRLAAVAATCCALLAALPALAQPKPITSVEGITEYRLENGLQVLLFPDPSTPTVTINVTYFVGSRHEGRGEKGMAHLLEHMVFKGTPNHPEIWAGLEDHGASFNGTTWLDRTNYYETLPSEPGHLEWALAMEADRMVNSKIAAEDLATEFSVVRNEFEMGENDPTGVLWERMMSTAYIWHNYGDSTIGSRSDIERVPLASLRAFYERYYQPDNAMLVVAGDFDPAGALALIVKHFGAIPRPARKLDGTYTIEPVQDGSRHVELERVGDVAAVGTVYHVPPAAHEDFAPLSVITQLLTDEPAGRLYQALVAAGKATRLFGVVFGLREPGVMVAIAQVPPDERPEASLERMIDTIEGLASGEITAQEVERAKRSLLKDIEMAMKSSGRIGVELSEWAAAGDWRLMFLHRDRLARVTTEQVQAVATRYFIESNRTSGVFRPRAADQIRRAEIPQAPDVATLLEGYTGGEALSEGESFEATPANIERRVTRERLDNGLQLALLPKQTRGDAVSALITLRFGNAEDLRGQTVAAGLIPDMLMRGSERHTFQQIRDRLDELEASVSMSGGGGMNGFDNSMTVTVRTDREHLLATLDLVNELLQTPKFPESEFAIVKQERLARLAEQLSDPQAQAFNYIGRALSPYPADDVRYVPTLEESIERTEAVSAGDLRRLHARLFGASFAQMTVIGDFDADQLRDAVGATLGQWSSPRPFARIAPDTGIPAGHEKKILTPDKQMAMVAMGTRLALRDDDEDYPALHLSNYVLGASAKSRLLERLRQREGLSYGTGSFFAADSETPYAVFAGMAISAPENAQRAQDSMVDELQRLVREGIPGEELVEAKASFALQVKSTLSNDGAVAGMLNEGLYLGRTMAYYEKLYESIDRLTPDAVKRALGKHVKLETWVRVQAGDLSQDG